MAWRCRSALACQRLACPAPPIQGTPYTLHPQPSTLNLQPSTLKPQTLSSERLTARRGRARRRNRAYVMLASLDPRGEHAQRAPQARSRVRRGPARTALQARSRRQRGQSAMPRACPAPPTPIRPRSHTDPPRSETILPKPQTLFPAPQRLSLMPPSLSHTKCF